MGDAHSHHEVEADNVSAVLDDLAVDLDAADLGNRAAIAALLRAAAARLDNTQPQAPGGKGPVPRVGSFG